MVDHARARRLAERIKVLVAVALERTVKDPDLGFVTVTDVRVTPDLQHAKVFYTVFGEAEQQRVSQGVIERNRGRIRGEVGRQLGIRVTPTLEFELDEVQENVAAINDLLAQAAARDEELHRLAAGAQFAGEENPYREPKVSEED